jgi:hypothetical protein
MAGLLDLVCIIVFGAWAYLVAKKKGRDEIVWAFVAAIAFFATGYAMQAGVFPALAQSFGWPATWQKPSGFLVGGVFALAVDLYLTLLVPPRGADEKPGDEEPAKPEAPPPDEGEEPDAEETPEAEGAADGERS